jgi:hypothetical protein
MQDVLNLEPCEIAEYKPGFLKSQLEVIRKAKKSSFKPKTSYHTVNP